MQVFFSGLVLGLSLIMSLGPQNLFLIKQGTGRNHAILSALVCFLCDLILITGSIAGLEALFTAWPHLKEWMLWSGAAFLLYYAIQTLHGAFRPREKHETPRFKPLSRIQIILFALGFSLLNPYAILDTMIIIGSGSSQYPEQQMMFLSGVITASLLWFSSLTWVTYRFAALITTSKIWQGIEIISGSMMSYIGLKLVVSAIK